MTDWEKVLQSIREMKKQSEGKYTDDKTNLEILLLGQDSYRNIFNPQSKKSSNCTKCSVVDNIFIVNKKVNKKKFIKDLAKTKPESKNDFNKKGFIETLIGEKMPYPELINDWVSELEKTISNRDATKVSPDQIDETREIIGNLITLSMESWYINQNIAGILRKCSQASGIPENEIEKDIVLYNDYSLESSFEYIKNEYITNSSYDELTRTNSVIKHCQDNYKPNELFKVKKFPKTITNLNEEAELSLKDDKKGLNTIKMDTIVSVLMEPYLSKKSVSSIEDFKMFYVLQNNKTKLKCYDQLRTFSMFTKFINKVIPK